MKLNQLLHLLYLIKPFSCFDLHWPQVTFGLHQCLKVYVQNSLKGFCRRYQLWRFSKFHFCIHVSCYKVSDFELHWPQNQMISTYTNFNTILVLFKVQYRATVYIMYEVSPNIDFCSYHVYKACRLTSNELWHPQISIQLQYELPSTVALSC